MQKIKNTRPPLESLACVSPTCDLYGQANQGNLIVRKVYGKDNIRYLRCRRCQEEFSERKNTALWNTKIDEDRAISIAEHLAEGNSMSSTSRLTKCDISTVQRLNRKLGKHGQQFHETKVKNIRTKNLQADERHGFAIDKKTAMWEAEVIDPASKFVISHLQGRRSEEMIRSLMKDTASRLASEIRHQIAFFTDGLPTYRLAFPEIFGTPYRPRKNSIRGRNPLTRYRIPRGLAHVQIIKNRSGRRLESVEIRYAHGSKKRIDQALESLGYNVPNTSAIERRNGTARLMSSAQTRKTLAFSRDPEQKQALGWWNLTVYNWCRAHRSLKLPLSEPQGKKSINSDLLRWRSV